MTEFFAAADDAGPPQDGEGAARAAYFAAFKRLQAVVADPRATNMDRLMAAAELRRAGPPPR